MGVQIVNTNGQTDFSMVDVSILVNTSGQYEPNGTGGGGGGTVQGGTNLGTATPVFAQLNGTNLEFRSLSGVGGLNITNDTTTVFISGNANGVNGPGAADINAVATWNNTAGTLLKNNKVQIDGAGNINLSGSIAFDLAGTASIGNNNGAISVATLTSLSLAGGTTNAVSAAGGTLTLSAFSGIVHSSNSFPDVSGLRSMGTAATPFALTAANQYVTTIFPQAIGGNSATINWNNGSSQSLNFNPGFSGAVTLTLQNGLAGSNYTFTTTQNPSGTTSLLWPAAVKWQGFVTGVPTASGNAVDVFNLYAYGTDTYYATVTSNFR